MDTPFPGVMKYKLADMIKGESVKKLQQQLSKRGFLSVDLINGIFDLYTEKAVRSYQISHRLTATGIVTESVWKSIFKSNDVNSDRTSEKTAYDARNEDSVLPRVGENALPHFEYDGSNKRTPFFNARNSNQLRKADLELRVDFGVHSSLNKRITHVYPRSVSIEVDSSGQPIYEVYEFIAQDIIESDNKYVKK